MNSAGFNSIISPKAVPEAILLNDELAPEPAHIAILGGNKCLTQQISEYLQKQNYRTRLYSNPQELKSDLLTTHFDLIIADMLQPNCPRGNGLFIEQFLSNSPVHVPIIMLATQNDLNTRLIALRAGIRAYLTKPIDPEELLKETEIILSRHNQDQSRVLMVDDDATLIEFYDLVLKEEGFKVKCISQPLEILENIDSFQPDVITLNYSMPGCNGLEVAELLKGDPRYMNIPIVFITSSIEAIDKQGVINIYGDGFLEKPVDIDILCNTLNKVAAKSRALKEEKANAKNIEITPLPASQIQLMDTLSNKARPEIAEKIDQPIAVEAIASINKLNLNESAILNALEEKSFQLVFQSIVKPEKEEHIFEVLARLVDSDGNIYTPKDFIPYLNNVKNGAYDFDRWVIEHAFTSLENTHGRGSAEFNLVIKLIPDLKHIKQLLPFIYSTISNTRLRGNHRIYFSTSEEIIMSDIPRAKRIIEALYQSRCGFIIDQWGGNEQSVELIDELKYIDFVKLKSNLIGTSGTKKSIKCNVKKLLSVTQGKTQIIAGIVENAKIFAEYWSMDVRYFQGFFIHHPEATMHDQALQGEALLIN